jgi:hypothetical protein
MKEDSGALFKALACFALRDINLTKAGRGKGGGKMARKTP